MPTNLSGSQLLPYICSAVVFMTLSLLLLAVRTVGSSAPHRPYERIKAFVGYSGLLYALSNILAIYCILHGHNIFILDSFIIPMIYLLQLILVSYALFGILYQKIPKSVGMLHAFGFIVIVFVGYGITYVRMTPGPYFSFAN